MADTACTPTGSHPFYDRVKALFRPPIYCINNTNAPCTFPPFSLSSSPAFSLGPPCAQYPDRKCSRWLDSKPEACPVYEVIDGNQNLHLMGTRVHYMRVNDFLHTMYFFLSTYNIHSNTLFNFTCEV